MRQTKYARQTKEDHGHHWTYYTLTDRTSTEIKKEASVVIGYHRRARHDSMGFVYYRTTFYYSPSRGFLLSVSVPPPLFHVTQLEFLLPLGLLGRF